MYSILDYGAHSNEEDSTFAIQQAIDACAASGGGTVLIPAGTFNTDMLTLKDNVELHLESGCLLKSLLKPLPEDGVNYTEASFNMKRYLIGGVGLNNASITGNGTIDGQGYWLFWNKNDGYEHPLYGQRFWPNFHRPRALLHFRECTDIKISGVTLLDPPAYNIWMLGCHRCDIDSIRIRTDLHGPNNDGIDIDCCSNIYIHGCDIITNDDAIGIFSDINTLGYDKPCENIVVSDCRIKAVSDAIRIGYVGDGEIRRVTISNCVIYETMIGISMMVAISPGDPRGVYIKNGPRIHDIKYDNLVIDAEEAFNFQSPKSPRTCPDPIRGYIDRVSMHNITATVHRGSFFGGVPESPLGTISISNLDMTVTGEMGNAFLDKVPIPYPTWTDMPFDGLPWPFYALYANDLTLQNCTVRWENATGYWQSELIHAVNSNVQLKDVRCINAPSMPKTAQFSVDFSGKHPVYRCGGMDIDELALDDGRKLPIIRAHSLFNEGERIDGWSEEDFLACFEKMAEDGISAVVWEASACCEQYECFYASSRYNEMSGSRCISALLSAAEKAGIKVYLGTMASTALWRESLSSWALERNIMNHRCAISELRKLGKLAGYYCPLCRPGNASKPSDFAARVQLLYSSFVSALKPGEEALLPVPQDELQEFSKLKKEYPQIVFALY